MGVFINKGEHPDVFKNNGQLHEPNQGFSKTDYLSELIKEQKQANSLLNHSFDDLKNLYQEQEHTHAGQWEEIGHQFKELDERHLQHKKFENHVIDWLSILDENNLKLQSMLEKEGLFNQEMVEQINVLSQSNKEMVQRLEEYQSTNQQLTEKLNEQLDVQIQMSEQLSKHEDRQSEVISRLENQEALTEKILRQVNNLRSILFERTNELAEKIENGYHRTSAYIYKLMTGAEHPRTVLVMNQKKGEDQK